MLAPTIARARDGCAWNSLENIDEFLAWIAIAKFLIPDAAQKPPQQLENRSSPLGSAPFIPVGQVVSARAGLQRIRLPLLFGFGKNSALYPMEPTEEELKPDGSRGYATADEEKLLKH
jgi:hypothetical protein